VQIPAWTMVVPGKRSSHSRFYATFSSQTMLPARREVQSIACLKRS